MKYIKLFEKYSQPDSVRKLSEEILNFIKIEFDKWYFKKSLANYSNSYVIEPPFKEEDFPVTLIELGLSFIISDKWGINREGRCWKTIIKRNGDLNMDIAVKMYIPKYKNSIDDDQIDITLLDILMHEIQHAYRSYKLQKNKIKNNNHKDEKDRLYSHYILDIRNDIEKYIHEIAKKSSKNTKSVRIKLKNDFDYNIINDFLISAYICSSKNEMSSYLSQMYANGGDFWVVDFLKISSISFEDIYKSFEPYSSIVYRNYNKNYENSWDPKDYEEISKSVIRQFYDLIQKNKNYLYKKIMKIKYQKIQFDK